MKTCASAHVREKNIYLIENDAQTISKHVHQELKPAAHLIVVITVLISEHASSRLSVN
jgi:dihydroneopterin aldolase